MEQNNLFVDRAICKIILIMIFKQKKSHEKHKESGTSGKWVPNSFSRNKLKKVEIGSLKTLA